MATAFASTSAPDATTTPSGTVDLTVHDPTWRDRALCHTDPSLGARFQDDALDFDPDNPTHPDTWEVLSEAEVAAWSARKEQVEAACKSVCEQCPVMQACRTNALTEGAFGVAGGYTEAERVELQKKGQLKVIVHHMPGPCDERSANGRVNDQEVARLLRAGLTRSEVALQVKCSPRTVARAAQRIANGSSSDPTMSVVDYSKKKPTPKRTVTPPHKVRDTVVLPPKDVINRPVQTGSVLSTLLLLDYTALIYDLLARAYQSQKNGGWVCFETILADVTKAGFISDDVAYAEFARTNSTKDLIPSNAKDENGDPLMLTQRTLTPTAAATDLDKRISSAIRAIVSNILYCGTRTKRSKDQPIAPKIEKYHDGKNAPWYRFTELAAESWIPTMSEKNRKVKHREIDTDDQVECRELGKSPVRRPGTSEETVADDDTSAASSAA